MKHIFRLFIAVVILMGAVLPSQAQYYEIANQIPGLLSPALSGSLRYKGYVELSGVAGVGDCRANFIGLSTTQGFRYASWFYMGVGVGIDVAMGQGNDEYDYFNGSSYDDGRYDYPNTSKTKAMVPVFTDLRFSVPSSNGGVSFFADFKLGAAWFLGDGLLRVNGKYMDNSTQFYFKPTLGLRVPVNSQKPNQAFNIGVSYMLLTSNNNYYWGSSSYGTPTLSNVGVTIGYEW